MTTQGHNSGIAGDQLRTIIERVERLNEDKAAITADIAEVLKEARGNGFDVATIRKVIRTRAVDVAKRQEQEALFELYWGAVGEVEL